MSIETQLEGLAGGIPHGLSEGVALGTGLADGYDFYDSALGQVIVTFNPEGVSSLDIADGFEDRYTERFGRPLIRAEAPKAWSRHIQESIERGSPGDLPVDLRSVTEFQRRVLRTTAGIPKGEVRPYGWVAFEIASPKAVRAVGSAVAKNPIPLIIPCHRVVRSDGHIGNYSLGGPHNKVELLLHEGARPDLLEELAAHNVRVRADMSTETYHHPSCHLVRSATDVLDLKSAGAAEARGLRACQVCRPHG
jgi:O-6-methylguanine DNA methyltransferase